MATSRAAPRRANAEAPDQQTQTSEPRDHQVRRSAQVNVVRPTLVASQQVRPVIESVRPQVDGGRRQHNAAVGDTVVVEADVIAAEHDVLTCDVRYRHSDDLQWSSVSMEPLVNDHWLARFDISSMGQYRFLIEAKVDPFLTWR